MVSADSTQVDNPALLGRAREGDEDAFDELAGAYRSELLAHCYRILGSVHDAEDALQEALVRAWKNLPGFEGRGSLRSWLYTIASNAAIDVARRKSRREVPVGFGPAARRGAALDDAVTDPVWLEPYPDRWLTSVPAPSPEASYDQRESVELAFVIALQHLPPLQRAVLLLREVVGLSAAEISGQLGTTGAAVNSALQRARATMRDRLPARTQQSVLAALGDQSTRALVARYADALERADADTLIGMLTEDATWSMPPIPTWFTGHAAVRRFLTDYPLTQRWKHRPAMANGQVAVAGYMLDAATGAYQPHVIDVLTLDGARITSVTAFLTAEAVEGRAAVPSGEELFAWFGLPAVPEA